MPHYIKVDGDKVLTISDMLKSIERFVKVKKIFNNLKIYFFFFIVDIIQNI